MSHRLASIPCALLLSGCVEPTQNNLGTDDPTSTTGDLPTGSGPATAGTAETSGDETDSASPTSGMQTTTEATGEGDAPPVVTAFTLDGSETPRAVTSGSTKVLAAEAMDDIGIDRVEFYDGDTLLATVDAPPYEASVFVTSADNGLHGYRAVAYDTIEQSAEASLDVDVEIEGGSIVEMRDDVMEIALDDFGGGYPYIAVGSDGHVHLVASELVSVGTDEVRRVVYRRFAAGLNLVASGAYPGTVDADDPHLGTFGPGALTADGTHFVHVIVGIGADPRLVAFDTTTTTGQPGLSVAGWGSAVAVDGDGNIYAGIGNSQVVGIAPDFASSQWSTSIPDDAWQLVGGPDYLIADCYAGSDAVVRRISSTGVIDWTRTVGSFASKGAVSIVEPSTETVATVFRDADGDVQMQLRDSDGNSLDAFVLTDPLYVPYAMVSDPQGALLIGGADAGPTPGDLNGDLWLARHALDGAEMWSTNLDMGWDPDRLAISSVAIGPGGEAYAAGWHDLATVDGWPRATLFVARIEL